MHFQKRGLQEIAVLLALFGAVLFFQWKSGALDAELAGYPDEAAHYVTSVMFHQYITEGGLQNPIDYAENYYLHYPKVAIGHWPPAYYLLTSSWMLIAGVSIKSALILQAVLAAIVGWLLFSRLRDELGIPIAGVVVALWILLPVTQNTYAMVMAELLLTVTSFLAATSFACFLQTKRSRPLLFFGFWVFAAVMTKGSGFALFAIPAVAILIGENRWILRDRRLYAVLGLCMTVLLAWQIYSSRMTSNGMDLRGPSLAVFKEQAVGAIQQFLPLFSPVLAMLGSLGIVVSFFSSTKNISQPFWLCQLGLVAGTYVMHIVSPTGMELRRILMAVPAFLAFSGLGLFYISKLVPARLAPLRMLIPAGALGVYLFTAGQIVRKPALGWRSFVASNLSRYNPGTPVLIAGGVYAENVIISEMAQLFPTPLEYFLRSSKLLADSDWNGTDYKLRVTGSGEVSAALSAIPINIVAVQDNPPSLKGDARASLQHWFIVRDLVQKNPQEWEEVASLPGLPGSPESSTLRLYERRQPILGSPHVSVDLGRSLGRSIEGN